MKGKGIIAIITARGGSKGIPRKNMILVNKIPLVAYTIRAALQSRYIHKTVVSSEDKEILQVAKKYGAAVVKRPRALAADKTSSEAVVAQVLEYLKQRREEYSILILLQPTSPLRDEQDIDAAIKKFKNSKATALISVYEPEHSPFKAFISNKNGFLQGIVNNQLPFIGRQDLPLAYFPNGAIYIVMVSKFIKNKRLFTAKTIPYIMPLAKSIDIDTLADVKNVEAIIKKQAARGSK